MDTFASLESVQRFEQEMLAVQERLAEETVDGVGGAGRVKVKLTGDGQVKRFRIIDTDLLNPERKRELERAAAEAFNAASTAVRELAARRAAEVAAAVGLS